MNARHVIHRKLTSFCAQTVSFEMMRKGDPAGKVVLSFSRNPESESALAGLLYVTVHSMHGFTSSSGWMDRTDPYVSLEFGKEKLKTTCKENVRFCKKYAFLWTRLSHQNLLTNFVDSIFFRLAVKTCSLWRLWNFILGSWNKKKTICRAHNRNGIPCILWTTILKMNQYLSRIA